MALSKKSNVNPKVFGPSFWQVIHFTAFGYPDSPNDEDKEVYYTFYKNIMKILPCDSCATSAQKLFKKLDIREYLDSREDLIRWTYLFHKSVNDKLKVESPSFEEFKYNFTHSNKTEMYKHAIVILTIIVILLLAIILLTHCT